MKTIKRFFYRMTMLIAIAGVVFSLSGLVKLDSTGTYQQESTDTFSRKLDLSRRNCSYIKASKFIENYSEYKCNPSYGYNILRYMSDSRDSIIISTPEKKVHDLLLAKKVTMGGYTQLGDRAEWRMVRKNGSLKPVALIIPVALSGFHGKSRRVHKHWFLGIAKVTKTQICITDVIASESGTLSSPERKAARHIADRSHSKKCK